LQSKKEDTSIKRMADLLRQGAALTDLACPACSAPLLRLKDGTLWCGHDQKKVIIVKEEEEDEQTTNQRTPQVDTAYTKLETILLTKIQGLEEKIEQTENIEELQKLSAALSELLSSLEKIKNIKTKT